MDLQELLQHKDFEQLSSAERTKVLAEMNQSDYQQQREIVKASQLAFLEEEAQLDVPPPSFAIQQHLQAQNAKKSGLFSLLNYPIKAWQAVAACFLLLLLTQWLSYSPQMPAPQATVQIVRDTIEIVKQIPTIKEVFLPADTVYKIIYKTKYLHSPDPNKDLPTSNEVFAIEEQFVRDSFAYVLDYYRPNAGTPVSQDSFLQLVSQEVGM